jgi:hypothetical protein
VNHTGNAAPDSTYVLVEMPPTDVRSESSSKLTVTEVHAGARIPVEVDAPDGCRLSQRQLVLWSLRRCPGGDKGREASR